jgi:hypothetical protein
MSAEDTGNEVLIPKKFATFSEDGSLLLRLDSSINEVPKGAVEVDEDLWRRMIAESDGVWAIKNGKISKSARPAPTAEEIAAFNESVKFAKLNTASNAMTPLLLSLQLGDSTDEEKHLAADWQSYYRAVRAVDPSFADPEWPSEPESR